MDSFTERTLLLAVLILTSILAACATGHHPLSTDERALMGKSVGVCVGTQTPPAKIVSPFLQYRAGPAVGDRLTGAGSQAVEGMKDGASLGKLFLSQGGACSGGQGGQIAGTSGCMVLLVLFLGATATGATVGGTMGAIFGFLSADPELTPEMAAAVTAARIPRALERHIHTRLTGLEPFRVSRCTVTPPGAVLLPDLPRLGVDSQLELRLSSIAFMGMRDTGPHRLAIKVKSTLVRARDFAEIDSRSWKYRSEGHTLAEWQADDAHVFVQELERFYQDLAEKVQKEFFAMRESKEH
jgi:hypothetical protein